MQSNCISGYAFASSCPSPIMNSDYPSKADSPNLAVVLPDGRRTPISEGEFRSLEGKLLFVRSGDRIEIRCSRSKALYAVEWDSGSSTEQVQHENDSESHSAAS